MPKGPEQTTLSSINKPEGDSHMEATVAIQEKDQKSRAFARRVSENPSGYLKEYQSNGGPNAYVAGGGLVEVFGSKESKIWNYIETSAAENQNKLTIAGIEFNTADLSAMGGFYRWLKDTKNFSFHCIDERLLEDDEHLDVEVHCKCGACAAVQAAVMGSIPNPENVSADYMEELLFSELYPDVSGKTKQDLLPGTEDAHVSRSILVDLSTTPKDLSEAAKDEALQSYGLPFSVSIPLEYVQEYAAEQNMDDAAVKSLLTVLVKWNVQIAQNIIAGHHNDLHELADQSLIILDDRGVAENPLLEQTLSEIASVVPNEADRWVQIAA